MKNYKNKITAAVLVISALGLSACDPQKMQALENGLRDMQYNYNMTEYGNPYGYQQPQQQRSFTCQTTHGPVLSQTNCY